MNNMEEDIKILEDLKKDFISLVSKKDGFVIEKDKRKKQIRDFALFVKKQYEKNNK